VKSGLKVKKDKVANVSDNIAVLAETKVMVGIPAEGAARPTDEKQEGEPITNAVIGYLNEFGAPENNLPARPHLVPGVESQMAKIKQMMRAAAKSVVDGKPGDLDKHLHKVGLTAQNAVRAFITQGGFVPLSPRTIAQREARGRSGDKPLIDTGQYRNAQTYVLRRKKDQG